jgi:sugar lactone lactonase YvrE
METADVHVAIRAEAEIGESPVFDARTGELCWVDLANGHLIRSDLARGTHRRWELGTMLGATAPRATQPGFAVAVAEGFGVVVDGVLKILDPVLPTAATRMNDAKCDPLGRLWAGSTTLNFTPGLGALHRWDGRSASSVMYEGLTLPNGLGWNLDADTMYLADSKAGTVMRASFDLENGEIGEFRTIATIDFGVPDGLAVDVEGCLWVAAWGGAAVHRIDPTGRRMRTIDMPVSQPSSCAFAADGTLYVTSARAGLDAAALRAEPLAGSVFTIATDTLGVSVAAFAV